MVPRSSSETERSISVRDFLNLKSKKENAIMIVGVDVIVVEGIMLDWQGLLFPSSGRMSKIYPDHTLIVQQMGDRIRKFLKKKGLDELTISFAVLGYGYFDLDKRGKSRISKITGRTLVEDSELYHNVLLFCCQDKDFAELIIQDKKQAAEVHRMALAISWETSE